MIMSKLPCICCTLEEFEEAKEQLKNLGCKCDHIIEHKGYWIFNPILLVDENKTIIQMSDFDEPSETKYKCSNMHSFIATIKKM